jgi:hypothetical protein
MNESPQLHDNPYLTALLVIAGGSALMGLIMMLGVEPDTSELIAPGQLVGSVLFGVGLLTAIAWLSVSAILWRKARRATEARTPAAS